MTLNRAKSAADRILARYGGEAELVRLEVTPPANSWESPVTVEVRNPVQLIETGAALDMIDGETMQASDVVGIMEATEGLEPDLTDVLSLDGNPHTILEVKPVRPAPDGPVTHYWLHARR